MVIKKIGLVTGSSRGLGKAVVRALLRTNDNVVCYITSNNYEECKKAAKELKKENLHPEYYFMDVTDKLSVKACADFIRYKHRYIDFFVNNAAIMNLGKLYPTYKEAKLNIDTNYRSLLTIEKYFFPLLRDNARVVNVTSACGHLSNLRNMRWLSVLKNPELTVEHVNWFVDEYLKSLEFCTFDREDFADEGKHAEHRVSKIALTALTKIQARKYACRGISVNAVHPGHMDTSMAKGAGVIPPEESAELVLYLLLKAPPTVKGAFLWDDGTFVDWYDHCADLYYKHQDVDEPIVKR